ncbi:MAG: DUF937 domain-containing protein [Gammaproteobacteria bacterium]|nr:DUF937 domain-containing protein [Gammaproteobacteria bacterium]NNF50616.1 DUF937 domain-containing protein [Woeseiaceae bacterium]MBT8094035.1 DUF937 domain-containing protein [Gammaproteobacteria bacterium]MBT8105694.1 DUF937 domain-containing protein [Gammaproteobacteria bacterium]NNK25708.1 DUF937 domain-containing protein [Woeseiaceae bacterium]
MNLLDLLKATGGGESVGQIAKSVGLGSSDTSKLVEALAPALMRGLQKNTASDDGLAGLRSALESGGHSRYLDDPSLMRSKKTRRDGNKILGHIFGSKDVSRNVAAATSQETGIDPGLIKKALPLLATLAMGAMSKQSSGGRDLGRSAKSGGLGPLGDIIGSLGGGASKSGLDDILGMARKFF